MGFKKREIYSGVEQWRIGNRGAENAWPGTMAKDNAAVNGSGTTTAYGRVVAGTIVALGPDGKLHPCGLAEITAQVNAAVALNITEQAAQNFFVGDLVSVVSRDLERDIAITGEADTEVFTSASPHGLMVGDEVTISDLTGGTGATAGTYTVATVPSLTTFTLTGVAYSTDISAGTLTVSLPAPAYSLRASGRNITSVNKETGAIQVSGAAFSAPAGSVLVKTEAYRPQGVLATHGVTQREVYGVTETDDVLVSVALAGDGRMRHCPGLTPTEAYEDASLLMSILKGGVYTDPLTKAPVTPKFEGFTFRDV